MGMLFAVRVHIPAELKPIFSAKQKECGVFCSIMHTKKGPIDM
jgi:hypothetical protein